MCRPGLTSTVLIYVFKILRENTTLVAMTLGKEKPVTKAKLHKKLREGLKEFCDFPSIPFIKTVIFDK